MCSLFQGRRKYWTLFFFMLLFVVLQVLASVFLLSNSSTNPFAISRLSFLSENRNGENDTLKDQIVKPLKTRLRSLQTTNLSFTPSCDIQSKEAISAITRAKSQECKQLIANVTCLMQNHSLIPLKLPRFCPLRSKCNFDSRLFKYSPNPCLTFFNFSFYFFCFLFKNLVKPQNLLVVFLMT